MSIRSVRLPKSTLRAGFAGRERVLPLLGLVLVLLFSACSENQALVVRSDAFRIVISEKGQITRFQDWTNGKDYESRSSPLLQLRKNGEYAVPDKAVAVGDGLDLYYPGGYVAHISITEKATHIVFELTSLINADSLDLVLWGPFATTINTSIGETVGIARGEEFAIGLQALNIRTLGGYPWNENDAMPEMDIFESGQFHDLDPSLSREVLYRVEAAKPDSMGSTFQAYTRNRLHPRVIPNRGYDAYVAPAYNDEGVVGSKIALFGVPVGETLDTIGAIELAEGLPHPMIDGTWGKKARSANAAYIIMNFGESTLEEALSITQKAGLRYLYHDGPFDTWGHFGLNAESFPHGLQSLRRVTDRAKEAGVMIGTHNLSNFVSTNDPFVTPVPDARLAKVGSARLASDLDKSQPAILISDPTYFNQSQKSYLMAAQIGDEIITFTSISASEPWQLRGVERGAFGTQAANHAQGSVIAKLDDHGYKVFLTETDLSLEMARNLAEIYNEAGLRQISFDGLEGNRSTGMGNYGESLFAQEWFDHLNDEIKSHYIADASRTTHFFWHMYTRMNWGEPWYAGFRESQTEYRLKNQAYFQRNLMPGMLGWFKMTPETTLEDIEWMLSLSAGYDAGYGFVTSFDAVEQNGRADQILALLGDWEKLRMDNAFSESQKAKMRLREEEFHLEERDGKPWLVPVSVHIFRQLNVEKQPGEPLESVFQFDSARDEQIGGFILTAEEAPVEGLSFSINTNNKLEFPIRLDVGESMVYEGGSEAVWYSKTGQKIGTIEVSEVDGLVLLGPNSLSFDPPRNGADAGTLRIEIRLKGEPEPIR